MKNKILTMAAAILTAVAIFIGVYVDYTKTGKIDPSYVSGSFWQTENQYQALFYYRPWGQRYDVLMGYGTGNSRR